MNIDRAFIEWLVMTEREFRMNQSIEDEDAARKKSAAAFKQAEIESEAALNAEIKIAVAKIDKKESIYE